jgi:hypothetical protein
MKNEEDFLLPGLEVGHLLYHNGNWAKIICEHGKFGVRWCRNGNKLMGLYHACLTKTTFVWRLAGSPSCPKVPKRLKYEPPNNQGRKFCFWHPKIAIKSKHIKKFGIAFHYCPECKR